MNPGQVESNGLAFAPIERAVFTPVQAVEFLALPSRDALQRLVDRGEIVPLTFTKEHRFTKAELDRFVCDEQEAERERRGIRGPM